MKDETLTGGCLCGAIRYSVSHRLSGAMICHCRMCQQATGSAFSAMVIYDRDRLEVSRGEPIWYSSSPIADRSFCGVCGSQLFIRYSVPEWRGWIAVSLGTHDDPNAVPAERHFGVETRQAWLRIHDDLPVSEYPDTWLEDVAAGNNDAYGALPRNAG